MKTSKNPSTTPKQISSDLSEDEKLFTKDNYKWMAIGLIFVILGFVLMAGGKSADPNVFNENEIYGFQRITLAPIVLVLGLVIEIYAIMKKKK